MERNNRPALARLGAGALALADPRAGADWVAWAEDRAERVLKVETYIARHNALAYMEAPDADPRSLADAVQVLALPDGLPMQAAQFRAGEDGWKPYVVADGVAVVPVRGLLVKELGWIGSSWATGYAELRWQIETALADPEVRGVALWIDSGGGFVAGLIETGRWLRQAREHKPIAAVIDGAACSAAYWLAAQADSIAAPEDGCVGSIGVYAVHWSFAKAIEEMGARPTIIRAGAHKAEGNELEDLPAEVQARWQAAIDETRQVFAEEVAAGRGARLDASGALATEALAYTGRSQMAEALRLGLVDAVAPAEEALAAFTASLAAARG